jgi:tripartite ATP-independent transporter DctM subunit
MSPSIIGIIGILVLLFFMLLGLPIGIAMASIGFVGFAYLVSFEAALRIAASDVFSIFSSYVLTTVPLFILMGQILFHSAIGKKLYGIAYKWIGHLPGGLAMATTGGCALFAAICGSPSATAATMGTVALPEMRRYNYGPSLACGTVAAGGTLGILIPPSITFIIYGVMVEESIGKLFISGVFPGLLLTGFFLGSIYIRVILRPDLGPRGERSSWKERVTALTDIGETIALFALVMGGLFTGLFTPTEAAAVGALGAIVVCTLTHRITWSGLVRSVSETVRISCMVIVILAGATIFGRFLAVSRIPTDLATWVGGLPIHPMAVMGLIMLVFFFGGCVMEALPLIVLTVPIFFPIVRDLGFSLIWFGVMIVIVGQTGLITPPVGLNVFIVKGVARDIPIETIFRGIFPFLVSMLLCIGILMAFPKIALFLPNLME